MSHDVDRLRVLARQGDPDAAWRLWHAARRLDDDTLAVEAVAGIADLDLAGELAERLWDAGKTELLEALSTTCGVTLDAPAREAIDAMLDHANSGRYARQMGRAGALSALFEGRLSPHGVGIRHAGEAFSSQGRPSTTLACAVRPHDGRHVVLGIQVCPAVSPTPGRAWPELSPWRVFLEDNLERARTWADDDTLVATRRRVAVVDSEASSRLTVALAAADAARDPLGELLAGDKTAKQFKLIAQTIDRLPNKDTQGIEVALERAERGLSAWPDEARVATVSVWNRLRKGKRKPSDALLRHLDLDKAGDSTVREVATSATSAAFHSIRLYEQHTASQQDPITPETLATLAASPHLAGMRALTVGTHYTRGLDCVPLLTAGASLTALRHLELACGGNDPVPEPERLRGYALPGVETLRLRGLDAPALRELVRAPAMASVRELDLSHNANVHEGLAALAASPHLARLEVLRLRACGVDDDALIALASSDHLRSLTTLELDDNHAFGPTGCAALADSPVAATLTELSMNMQHGHSIDDAIVSALAGGRALVGLEVLELPGPYWKVAARITAVGAAAMADAPWLDTVRVLELERHALGDDGVTQIVDAPRPPHNLERLTLTANGIGERGAAALAQAPALRRLERLDLSSNPLGDAGFAALVRSPYLTSLRTLVVNRCEIGAAGALALANSEHLPALEHVLLDGNALEAEGTAALAGSQALSRLRWISLHGCKLGKGSRQVLEQSPWLEGRFTGIAGYPSANRVA